MLTTKPKFRSNGLIGKYLNHTASDIHHIGGSSECSVQGQMGRWISGHTNASFNTSLTTPTPVRKYVEVKIHVPMHVYITQPAYNNEPIRL